MSWVGASDAHDTTLCAHTAKPLSNIVNNSQLWTDTYFEGNVIKTLYHTYLYLSIEPAYNVFT